MNFDEKFAKLREDIEAALEKYTAYDPAIGQAVVMDAMRYSLLGGGKRIRAVLALEFCDAFGCDKELAMPAACALEMVHAYSLIHDDLPCMDDDDMRRGKPSNHKKFGEGMAVLAGDGLLTLAFETLSCDDTVSLLGAEKVLKLVKALSFAAGEYGMLGGQVIDVTNEGVSLPEKQHREMVAMKTGALIKCAVLCGCISAGASDEEIVLANSYAEKVGLAFQITDDILDVVGDSAVLGKNIGSDEKENKVTFVTLYGLETAKRMADGLFDSAQSDLKKLFPKNEFLPRLTALLAGRNS